MAKYQLDLSEFGISEIYQVMELLKLSTIEKNKGNQDLWLDTIEFNDNEGSVYMIDDDGNKYFDNNGKLELMEND